MRTKTLKSAAKGSRTGAKILAEGYQAGLRPSPGRIAPLASRSREQTLPFDPPRPQDQF